MTQSCNSVFLTADRTRTCIYRVPDQRNHDIVQTTTIKILSFHAVMAARGRKGNIIAALFSPSSLEKQLPAMLRSIFEVPVDADDGFPMYTCIVETACPLQSPYRINLTG